MSLYEINLQREILREKSAEILADFHRYMEEKNIEQFDLNTPIGILHKVVGGIYRNIFKSEYETREKIDEANGKLDLAKEILKNSYLQKENYIKFKEFYEEYTKLSFLDSLLVFLFVFLWFLYQISYFPLPFKDFVIPFILTLLIFLFYIIFLVFERFLSILIIFLFFSYFLLYPIIIP